MPHDWGGPIGLAWATGHPDRIAGLFILNTIAHGLRPEVLPMGRGKVSVPAPLHLLRAPAIGELLVQGVVAFKPLMFGLGIEDNARPTPAVRRAYRSVHAGWPERAAMLAFARQLPVRGGGAVNEINSETEALMRRHFRSRPIQILWGCRDRMLPASLTDNRNSSSLGGVHSNPPSRSAIKPSTETLIE